MFDSEDNYAHRQAQRPLVVRVRDGADTFPNWSEATYFVPLLREAADRIEELERERKMLCGRCGHAANSHDEETPSGWCEDCAPDSGADPDPDHRFLDSIARIAALEEALAGLIDAVWHGALPIAADKLVVMHAALHQGGGDTRHLTEQGDRGTVPSKASD